MPTARNGLHSDNVYEYAKKHYSKLKWILIRVIFAYGSVGDVVDMIVDGIYSIFAVIVVILHNIPEQYMYMLDEIDAGLKKRGFVDADDWEKYVYMVKEYEKENMPSAEYI